MRVTLLTWCIFLPYTNREVLSCDHRVVISVSWLGAEPPQTRVIANGQEFEVGQTFSAICYMNVGNGKERFVEWRRRVGNTSYPVLSQYVNSTMAILKMPNLNLRDAGEYHCVGTDPEIGHQSLRSFASSATLVVRQPGECCVLSPGL